MSADPSDLDLGQTLRGFAAGQKLFNRYTLVRLLGRGGMGVVWLARDEELGRETALKFLPEVVATDRAAVEDMKREVRRAIDLAHPHIVKIHDFVTDGALAAVSMEYVAGYTLSSARCDEPGQVFTVEKLAPLVRQLGAALDYAHEEAQVVHRDLKPANLMLDRRGRVKVLDFGIAASITDSVSRVSRASTGDGSLPYMSPQQLAGEKPAVADDIYSIGATLYELLTGKPPFYRGGAAAIMHQVQTKAPATLAERRTELGVGGEAIPAVWEETIAACLAKDRADRPQTAGEIVARLGRGAADGGKAQRSTFNAQRSSGEQGTAPAKVAREGPTAPARSGDRAEEKKPSKLRGALWAGLAAAVIVLAGGGYYFGVYAPEQARLAEVARLEASGKMAGEAKEKARLEAEALALRTAKAEAEAKEKTRQEAEALVLRAADEKRQAEAARIAAERRARPQLGQAWENTLGMKFGPVPGASVLFSIWETRVQDFAAFVSATRYDATGGMYSLRNGQWGQHGDTWQSPGFAQGPTHPVVGVNEADAKAFCEWLTAKERKEGRLGPDQSYRLPTDGEWEQAVGPGEFPWGSAWPPPRGSGNFADATAKRKYTDWKVSDGYDDGFADTAPVGSFTANRHGIFDLGGNVLERVGDRSAGLRGASFSLNDRVSLASSSRSAGVDRDYFIGFRVVVAVGSAR